MEFDSLDEKTLRLRTGEKWQQYPPDVLPAWVADMDFEPAEAIATALRERLDNADLGYPRAFRDTGLAELFVTRMADRFAWHVKAGDITPINDVVQGIYLGLLSIAERGDGVIIQTPIYPPFLRAAKHTERAALICPLRMGGSRYEIDFDDLRDAARKGARVLLFCNPHNPTGRAFSQRELEELANFAVENDLWVISDEIHADLTLGDTQHIPIASLNEQIAERTITLMSASKAFNIAGLCMAFVHCQGAQLKKLFASIPAHTRGGTNALSIAAVRAAWTQGGAWQTSLRAQLTSNRDTVARRVGVWSDFLHQPPEATYLAWIDCNHTAIADKPYEFFLEKARVALSDGRAFGRAGEGFVRLNFATSSALLDEILSRLEDAIAEI
ncbi:MAG: PatB family C-S lyase [Pseudomonadota bacterium]